MPDNTIEYKIDAIIKRLASIREFEKKMERELADLRYQVGQLSNGKKGPVVSERDFMKRAAAFRKQKESEYSDE